jgi:hypothetical protein
MPEGFSTGESTKNSTKPSKWWYLVPIFAGFIGGLIGWLVLKDKDKKFAKRLLIIGIVVTVVTIILTFILPLLSFLYMSHRFTEDSTSSFNSFKKAAAECSNVSINILSLAQGTIVVTNPSQRIIYIHDVEDIIGGNIQNISTKLEPGDTKTLSVFGIPSSTGSVIVVSGFCEDSTKTQNLSISGFCKKGDTCWQVS